MCEMKRKCISEIGLRDGTVKEFLTTIKEKIGDRDIEKVELEFYSDSVELYVTEPKTEEDLRKEREETAAYLVWREEQDRKELMRLIEKYGIPNERTNL